MDLELDLSGVRTVGRAARPVTAAYVRDVSEADLALLATEAGIKPPSITRIRESHHRIAQAFAEGLKPYEVAIRTGYSQSRISILQNDPAIQDLISTYVEDNRRIATDAMEAMALLNKDATQILHERLNEREGTEAELDTELLLKIVTVSADRTGMGPQTKNTQVNVNVNLGARLEAARQRAGMIEGTVLSPQPPIASDPVGCIDLAGEGD